MKPRVWENGMLTSIETDERVKCVHVDEDVVTFDLMDGRTVGVPIVWYPRLLNGTPKQRANWRISAAGYGVHWPDLDEDLSVAGVLRGAHRTIADRETDGQKSDGT